MGYPLVDTAGVAVLELRAKVAGVVRLVFDATAPSGERQFRIQDAQGEQPFTFNGSMHFDLNVAVQRGVSQLVLKTDPAPTSEADAVVLSRLTVEPGSGAATLHAIPASGEPGF